MTRDEIVRDAAFAACDAASRNTCTCRTMYRKVKCLVRRQEAEAAVSLCFARAAAECSTRAYSAELECRAYDSAEAGAAARDLEELAEHFRALAHHGSAPTSTHPTAASTSSEAGK